MLEHNIEMLQASLIYCYPLAMGGTAVGTGLNAPQDFGSKVALKLAEETSNPFFSSENKFHALTSKDAMVFVSGSIKALAANAFKIANDVRWLASGPRSGLGEISIPENEPGSSIMPGKVNPTQAEALTMVCTQVMGNDATIGFAASQGNFELNVYMPVIIYNMLQSIHLLADALDSFNTNCAVGIKPNLDKIKYNLDQSLMLVTALNPHIGYENAAKIAKNAYQKNITLKQSALDLKLVSEKDFDEWVKAENMI
jgi:fumarate hydratase class II